MNCTAKNLNMSRTVGVWLFLNGNYLNVQYLQMSDNFNYIIIIIIKIFIYLFKIYLAVKMNSEIQ